jgi:hypothetical protein
MLREVNPPYLLQGAIFVSGLLTMRWATTLLHGD